MTNLNDPDRDAQVLRSYTRGKRRQRWRRRWRDYGGKILGAGIGLIIAGVISYGGLTLYWDHQRLEAVLDQMPPAATATAASIGPPAIITALRSLPSMPVHDALAQPRPSLWAPGSWEASADAYLKAHAYDGVSSATPPPRRRHPGPRHHQLPGTLSPPAGD